VNITGYFIRAVLSHKAISQRYEQAHTTCESNLWPIFTSLKNSYPNGCIFFFFFEMWRCPCGTTPFQQLINNEWQLPGLPQRLHCTGLTSDPLQNQTDDILKEVDLDCKVTGEKLPAVLLNYKQCGGSGVLKNSSLPCMSAMQWMKLLECLRVTSRFDGFPM
jgi:hypothetical protein